MSGQHSTYFFNNIFTYVMYGYKITISYVPQKWNTFKIYQEIVGNQNLSKWLFQLRI